MQFNVPQYIEVEDKVAGPLTAKQLGWMLGMGAVLFILWLFLEKIFFWATAIPVALIFVSFAFIKPHGFPLTSWVFHLFSFVTSPREYIWQRPQERLPDIQRKETKEEKMVVEHKTISSEELSSLARTLDSEGSKKDEAFEKILKKYASEKKKS